MAGDAGEQNFGELIGPGTPSLDTALELGLQPVLEGLAQALRPPHYGAVLSYLEIPSVRSADFSREAFDGFVISIRNKSAEMPLTRYRRLLNTPEQVIMGAVESVEAARKIGHTDEEIRAVAEQRLAEYATQEEATRQEIAKQIAERRQDPEFMQRVAEAARIAKQVFRPKD